MVNTFGRMHMSSHLVISASASHVHGKVFQAAGEQLESSWRKNLVVIWRSLFDRTRGMVLLLVIIKDFHKRFSMFFNNRTRVS